MSSLWIISPRVDFLTFGLAPIIALTISACTRWSVPIGTIPLWWWFVLGVFIDVAHVYGTLYRTVLDSEAVEKNRRLFLVAGPGMLVVSLLVNVLLGTTWAWSLLAYFAMWHFAKQPFGFLCLYKARFGERGAADHQWDYWVCIAGAALPILIEHTKTTDSLEWFYGEDELLFHLPVWFEIPLRVVHWLIPALWLARLCWHRVYSAKPFNWGKISIMALQYLNWYMGSSKHHLTALAWHNLSHGVSSMVLVYYVVQRRYDVWKKENPSTMKWLDRMNMSLCSSPWAYLMPLLALAFVEETLWDVTLDHRFAGDLGLSLPDLTELQKEIATAFLMLPQLSHYFLDSYIWKMTGQNPGLRDALMTMGLPGSPAASSPKKE